jgi:M6 family metalloprotease-like protein
MLVAVLAMAGPPAGSRAQQVPSPPRARREIPGFDFRKDGVWRRQGRAVRALRARLLSRRNFGALNAPMAAAGAPLASGAAVSGVLRVPTILFKFKDTPAATLRNTTQYNQVLFAASPTGASAGRPYTYRSFYEELSNGLLSVQGQSYGYAALDSNEVTYAGVPGTCTGNNGNCNGLFSGPAVDRMQGGLREALQKLDNQVDWAQYDADGDGIVDLVVFIQPAIDGACGGTTNNHLWSHRYFLTAGPYATHSRDSRGRRIVVSDYTLQSGVGGADGCDATQIMPVGTVAHETGHGFGLPDLYDTSNQTEGVGEYSLMGSGNYTSSFSPSRMDAWSLNELGWVTIVPISTGNTYAFGPAPTSDTAFYLPVAGANPRGEYFLLENRQPVQSDSAMLRDHCQAWYASPSPPASCGGGLLIWHVDSAQIARASSANQVDSGPIHGLAIVQADGYRNLERDPSVRCAPGAPTPSCSDRGDAGDLYPGPTNSVAFTPTTVPAAVRNSDGLPAGPVIDQITPLPSNSVMQFRLSYPVWVVRAAPDTAALIQFDDVSYHVFRGILTPSSTHTVAVDSAQLTGSGRTKQLFVSWSDGLPRNHSYTAGASPETLTVNLARSHRLDYSGTNGGAVAADTVGSSVASGSYLAEGTNVILTATTGSLPFISWLGDTVSKSATITLPMRRPYTVRAAFLAPLNAADVVSQLLNGTGLTPQQQLDLDQLGNNNGVFDLGDFLAWTQATGPAIAAERGRLRGALNPRKAAR